MKKNMGDSNGDNSSLPSSIRIVWGNPTQLKESAKELDVVLKNINSNGNKGGMLNIFLHIKYISDINPRDWLQKSTKGNGTGETDGFHKLQEAKKFENAIKKIAMDTMKFNGFFEESKEEYRKRIPEIDNPDFLAIGAEEVYYGYEEKGNKEKKNEKLYSYLYLLLYTLMVLHCKKIFLLDDAVERFLSNPENAEKELIKKMSS